MAQRKKWNPERMKSVIKSMNNKEICSYKASSVFNVPQTTLEPYIKGGEKSSNEAIKTKLGRKQVLPCEAENDVAELCLLMEKFFWLDNSRRHASRLPTFCNKRN
jgi:hypothetical protein